MNIIQGNRLIAYVYHDDEQNIPYATSDDEGFTWSTVKTTFLAKALRNPQLSGNVGGVYFLHGRSGQRGDAPRNLVLYRSVNGIDWDAGVFLNRGPVDDSDSYSTNEIIGKYDASQPRSLLIQATIAYDGVRRVNLHHWQVAPARSASD